MTEERLQHIIRAIHDHFEIGGPLNSEDLTALELLCDRTLHLTHTIDAIERCYRLLLDIRLRTLTQEQVLETLSLRKILHRLLTIHGRRVPRCPMENKG